MEQPMSSSLGYSYDSRLSPIPSCVQVEKSLWGVSSPHLSAALCRNHFWLQAIYFFYYFCYYFGNISIRAKFWTVLPARAQFSSCCQAQTKSAWFFTLFVWQI